MTKRMNKTRRVLGDRNLRLKTKWSLCRTYYMFSHSADGGLIYCLASSLSKQHAVARGKETLDRPPNVGRNGVAPSG